MKIERGMDEILGQFFKNYEKLEQMYEIKLKELSDVDKELVEFYHFIEGSHFSHNTQAHNPMLRLQDILGRRRQAKLDIILAKSFIDNTSNAMHKAKTRSLVAITKHQKVLAQMG